MRNRLTGLTEMELAKLLNEIGNLKAGEAKTFTVSVILTGKQAEYLHKMFTSIDVIGIVKHQTCIVIIKRIDISTLKVLVP